jgi:hypothetical protein
MSEGKRDYEVGRGKPPVHTHTDNAAEVCPIAGATTIRASGPPGVEGGSGCTWGFDRASPESPGWSLTPMRAISGVSTGHD